MSIAERQRVKSRWLRSCNARCVVFIAALLASLWFAPMAQAQLSEPPPVFTSEDGAGVDLGRGVYSFSMTDVSIGQPGAGGLAFVRSFRSDAAFWRHNFVGTLNTDGPGIIYTVSIGNSSETFTLSGNDFVSNQGRGSSLVANWTTGIYTYTTSSGAVALFDHALGLGEMQWEAIARITQLTMPNGERISFHYRSMTSPILARRLQSVTNNLGYQLHFDYESDAAPTHVNISIWRHLTQVTAINNAVDYCSPTADDCTGLSTSWPTATYVSSFGHETVTDALGQQTRLTFSNTPAKVVAIRRASSTSVDHIGIDYDGSGGTGVRVEFLARQTASGAFDLWSYSYSGNTTTITDPLNHTRTVVTNSAGQITSETDALSRTTSYQYDTNNRLTRITRPEGDHTRFTYDARGNVTETRRVAKPGSGLGDLVETASYPSMCLNPVTCNLPLSTTNVRGFTTDYAYDSTHGGVLTVTAPDPDGGGPLVRPQTRFGYDDFHAYYKDSLGSITAAAAPVWRPIETSACATTSSCDGDTDETVTTIAYGSTGVANNLLPTATTTAAGDNAVSATSSFAYDAVGNQTTVDGPLAGAADTVRTRYDANRQVVGVIGPDPDGGGSLKHRAIRFLYNADGQVTAEEHGAVNSQSDGDWAAFAPLERSLTTYDSAGRPVAIRAQAWISSAWATQALAQTAYDAAWRTTCSALRMNAADFASPPAACTQGTGAGDRITQTGYNNADQPTSLTRGVGASSPITEWTASYTNNGLVATLTDAAGNVAAHEYDGFDRLFRLRFPNASGGGSSGSDYEQNTYGASGATAALITQQRRRDGTTLAFAYDNLARAKTITPSANGPVTATAYDNFSRAVTVSASDRTLTYVYDQLSRLLSETHSVLGTVSYQYDAAGRRTRMTWPDSFFVTYDYDLTHALTRVRENGAGSGIGVLAAYAYDDLGRRISLTRGNGTSESYGYDAESRLSSLVNDLASTSHDQTLSFTYSEASQLLTRANSNTNYQWSPSAPATTNYADNGLNQYTSVAGTSFSYDSRGNLTSDGSRTFAYDIFNRLTSVSGAASLSLAYDPAGRLYETQSGGAATRFLYDGASLIAEYNASGTLLRRYVHGAAIDEPLVWYEGSGTGDRRWLMADERGSVAATMNDNGAATAVHTYDEYGRPDSWNGARLRYTGQMMLPEAQLYHYRARVYDPALGRFLQTDPILFAGGMNLYAYVGNDPMNATDPFGLQEFTADEFVVTGRQGGEASFGFWNWPTSPRIGPAASPPDGNACLLLSDAECGGDEEVVVTARCEDSPGCMRIRQREARARDALRWLPGVSLYYCVESGCDALGWGLAGLEVAPLGRGVRLVGRVCDGGCFEEGTLVATPDGLRRIEEIEVGDLVIAWDEATGETRPQRVTALIRPEPKLLWRLEVRDGGGDTETFHATDDHPWYVEGEGWVETQHLRPDQRIETADDRGLTILDIARTDRVERTYNLEVAGLHTFLVGEDGAVVHNCRRFRLLSSTMHTGPPWRPMPRPSVPQPRNQALDNATSHLGIDPYGRMGSRNRETWWQGLGRLFKGSDDGG